MTETRPAYRAEGEPPRPLPAWQARLLEEVQKAVRNPHRPAIIVLAYERGCWRVLPTAAGAKVEAE